MAFAFADPAWPLRYVTVAAVLLIPVVGYIAMLGWQARVFEHARLGRKRLPAIELPGDIRRGVTTFINVILLAAVPLAITLFVSLPFEAVGVVPQRWIDAQLVAVAAVFLVFFTYPELLRRALVHEERLAILKPFPSFRVIWREPQAFFFTVICTLVASVLAALGVYAFLIGILFTLPIGHAVAAHAVMQWQRDIEGQRAVEIPVD